MQGHTRRSRLGGSTIRAYARRLVLALLCLLVFQAIPPSAEAATLWTVRVQHTGKCLDVKEASLAAGATIQQWDCGMGSHQLWYVDDLGNGYYTIRNYYSNMCLDVENLSNADGARVHQWPCYANPYQEWVGYWNGTGYQVVNRGSGKCLDVTGWSSSNGATIQQWTCQNTSNQLWTFS